MTNEPSNSSQTQHILDRLAAGDDKAADELIEYAMDRLRRLVRKQLQNNPRIHRWEVTDDVLQNSLMRLHRALKSVKPATKRDFINLAATQIRRELIDLARHHFGPQGERGHYDSKQGANQESGKQLPFVEAQADSEPGPTTKFRQNESNEIEELRVHQIVDTLPEREREVFSQIFYLGLQQAEVANQLGISVPTVKNRWRAARLMLANGIEPGALKKDD